MEIATRRLRSVSSAFCSGQSLDVGSYVERSGSYRASVSGTAVTLRIPIATFPLTASVFDDD